MCERFMYVESDEGDYMEAWLNNGFIIQLFGDGLWLDDKQISWEEIIELFKNRYPNKGMEA